MLTTYRAKKRDYLNLMNTQLGGNYRGLIYIYHGPTTLRDDYTSCGMGEIELEDWKISFYLESGENYLYRNSDVDPIEKTINEKNMQYYLVIMKNIDSEPSTSWISGIDLSGAESFHEITTGVDLAGLMKINFMDKLNSDKPFNLYVVSKKYTDKYPNIPIYNKDVVKEELVSRFKKPISKPRVEPSLPKPIVEPSLPKPRVEPITPVVEQITASEVVTEIYEILDKIEKELSGEKGLSLGCTRFNFVITSHEGKLKEYIKKYQANCNKDTDLGVIESMKESVKKIADHEEIMDLLEIPKDNRNLTKDAERKQDEMDIKNYGILYKVLDKITNLRRER